MERKEKLKSIILNIIVDKNNIDKYINHIEELYSEKNDVCFMKVIANKTKLFDEGIDEDLTGKVVKVIDKFNTGYVQIEGIVQHEYTGNYCLWDIPLIYLEKI